MELLKVLNFVTDLTWDFSFFCCSEFCRMVKRIYIYSYEEAKSLTPKAKLPVIGDTIKPDPNKLSPESDMPQSDTNSNAPVAADKD
jgi:auxin response factor